MYPEDTGVDRSQAERHMESAIDALSASRKSHYLRALPEVTLELQAAVSYLEKAVKEVRNCKGGEDESAALVKTVTRWKAELVLAHASHAHAEAWAMQWVQKIQTAFGNEAGYTQAGTPAVMTQPVRVVVEG